MPTTEVAELPEIAVGGGEMGERVRAFDWSRTPLGPMESWSASLKMMVRLLLANRFPLLLWWGPEFVQIYNDAYRPVLGAKHPFAGLGQPCRECWSEIWHVLRPLIETPFKGGPATWMDDIFLEVQRYGFTEETHFTIAYSPVPDETAPSGIGGVLATVHETTEKVIGERRVVCLRDLGAHVGEAKTAEQACEVAARVLAAHDKDVPFVLLYLLNENGKEARLCGAAGVTPNEEINPSVLDLTILQNGGWPFAETLRTGTLRTVEDLQARFKNVPTGPWSDPPTRAVIAPIASNKTGEPAGIIVAGVSARLKLDEFYRDFFELIRTQVATAIANARAYEEERQRAEALAEIDRAKTAFFSNVSHEFRTPLTLMLGPIEELLALGDGAFPEQARESLALAHRNSLRLLRLVNTMLDFSRIEAARIQANYEPTDLAAYTAELASTFRSAIEKAGLRLVVECPPLPDLLHIDREMWEKIVLNLLSNAFKFTFDGEIRIALRWLGERVELTVSDTGVGIAEAELPRVFDRFHRVRGARSRTHEGTGIGLALVQELARLHGGEVDVQSAENRGTAFTVSIQTGVAHLPADRIRMASQRPSSASNSCHSAFLEEALRWLPNGDENSAIKPRGSEETASSPAEETDAHSASPQPKATIVLADDNADMRDYVARLLRQKYQVLCTANGQAALKAAIATKPDLILSDVMMPELDGFGLLQAVRGDDRLRQTPVILVSARAGEESRINGLGMGADDFLVKPFSSRELMARVDGQIALAKLRSEAEARYRSVADNLDRIVSDRTAELRSTNEQLEAYVYSIAHDLRAPLRAMTSFAQILVEEHAAEVTEPAREMLRRIRGSAEFMDRLLLDLLAYGRAARAEMELRIVPVKEAWEIARFQCATDIDRSGATLQEGELCGKVIAHGAMLGQCFANLLSNAMKFVAPGVKPVVRVWSEEDPENVRVWVEDNGIGMPRKHHEKAFRVFERLNGNLYPGTGIGLSIVRKGVERMGGRVGVESEPGKGSRFWIELRKASPIAVAEQ